jgi:hypothetical protein
MSGLRAAAAGVLVTGMSWGAATSAHAADAPARWHVSLAICDAGHVPPELLVKAERIAGDVYRDVGVALDWNEDGCNADGRSFIVNVAARDASDEALPELTLGFAEPGSSAATVLYDQIGVVSRRHRVKREVLLGYVMAHEIAHLLLPPHSHSIAGLMRATLDLEMAAAKRLRFTREQGTLIVRKIEGWQEPIAVATH